MSKLEAVLRALSITCYCHYRIVGACIPCVMASRIKAGEGVDAVLAEYFTGGKTR
jgi:hypothetical protein